MKKSFVADFYLIIINYPGVPLTIAATNNRRLLPIPQAELDANPNIRAQQNPGY